MPEIEVPDCVVHVWNWFWALDAGRAPGMTGPAPLSFVEIDAWRRLMQEDPRPWEIRAIKAMDAAYLSEWAKRAD